MPMSIPCGVRPVTRRSALPGSWRSPDRGVSTPPTSNCLASIDLVRMGGSAFMWSGITFSESKFTAVPGTPEAPEAPPRAGVPLPVFFLSAKALLPRTMEKSSESSLLLK